ncbi:hypothetical protein PTKIN_Ptkin10aG0196400 [Pterospermum kingtungense]
MEFKLFSLFVSATISLLFLVPLLFSETVFARLNPENQSPFGFLKQLEGCRKGDKVRGINELKSYLKRFGYLISTYHGLDDDSFDEVLESAIKTYQINYNLKVTGTLNTETISVMNKPRCGVPDIINGKTRMYHPNSNSSQFHAVSRYTFFPGEPKWPPSKTQLTYAVKPGTRPDVSGPLAKAFFTWGLASNFTFSEVQDFNSADLKISFETGDHGDGLPFDGPGGALAHASAPPDGRFHFDATENWVVGAKEDAYDLSTVCLHEIGHLLGLQHSSVQEAIMFALIDPGKTKGLNDDDVSGIRDLYT